MDRLCAEIEIGAWLEADSVIGQETFEIALAALEIVDVGPRDLSFGDRIETNTLDARLFAGRASRKVLITTVLADPAAITGGDIAERGS